eukprot:3006403-Prymnesium_polylepis.1
MRFAIATRNAAIASDAIVSSPRILFVSRSHGSGSDCSGASAPMTSEMLAFTALGATRRESCAQTSTRTRHGSAVKRPRRSRVAWARGSAPSSSSDSSDSSSGSCERYTRRVMRHET